MPYVEDITQNMKMLFFTWSHDLHNTSWFGQSVPGYKPAWPQSEAALENIFDFVSFLLILVSYKVV